MDRNCSVNLSYARMFPTRHAQPSLMLLVTLYSFSLFGHLGSNYGVIPTAPNIDSLRDSQIRESLTRCWLLKEEQHRWVQRLRSDGLI